MSLLEAMSHGLPCVAFADCDGVSDIISHGENGLLAKDMTAEALAQEMDEVSGRMIVTPLALGQKNGPAMTPLFGDIVLCEKNGAAFTWSTMSTRIECLKNSFLPLKDKINPGFEQLVDRWLTDNGV